MRNTTTFRCNNIRNEIIRTTFMKIGVLIFFLFVSSSCSKSSDSPASSESSTAAEIDYCSTSTTYSPSVIVSGTATFFKRGLTLTVSSGAITRATLSAPISSALPVKYAEIRVLDASGKLVQCGKTDASGNLKALDGTSSLTIPGTTGTYTVEVLARSNHTMSTPSGKPSFKFLTSVKKDIYSNEVYHISGTISSTGSSTVSISLIAYARESESTEILGGAFNIYNDLAVSFDYLAQNTGNSDLSCLSPKMDVYWKAGFNPAQYIYPSADPNDLGTVSFYVRGDSQLFINGGVLGNVTSKDTDHFDDAVIIHELGHRIEDACGKMDSPGGTHYGLYRIDPRFAWSEGWGNFFGAHVIRNNTAQINPDLPGQLTSNSTRWDHYADTVGYIDGSTTTGGSLINLNLIKAGNNPEQINTGGGLRWYDKVDAASFPGEGHTREISVARGLYKNTNSCTTYCVNANNFSYYWQAFENSSSGAGMGKSTYPFRSSVRFYDRLNSVVNNNAVMASIDATLATDEAQQYKTTQFVSGGTIRTWPLYGIKLVKSGSTPCSPSLQIQPRNEDAAVTNKFSDQRYSNHFYNLDLSLLAGVTSITLTANKASGTSVDIDLILYKEDFHFNQDCVSNSAGGCDANPKELTSTDMVLMDRSNASDLTSISKTIQNLAQLSAANSYMLDVRAYTSANSSVQSTTAYNYTLTTQAGEYLCPSSTY